MNETTDHIPTPAEQAFARLDQFPSDPIEAAVEAGKELRMDEMENWANAMGAHVERKQDAHREAARDIIKHARLSGTVSPTAEINLRSVSDWRTGVKVDKNGDVEVHPDYPFSGDTPRAIKKAYRSPKNIRKQN